VLAAINCDRYQQALSSPTPSATPPLIEALTGPDGTKAALAFGDAQTGQLDVANRSKATILAIGKVCQDQQAQILEALAPKPWWRWSSWGQ
jgi:hypothetical protein